MSKFAKKRGKASPAISTASLPDIIFMLLFFFMVVTVLRDAELKVKVVTPYATELTKLEKKSLVNYLYIGKPLKKFQELYGPASWRRGSSTTTSRIVVPRACSSAISSQPSPTFRSSWKSTRSLCRKYSRTGSPPRCASTAK